MILTIEEIKGQLRLEEDYDEENNLLEMLGKAAEARTVTYLNRKLYALAADVPGDDPDGMVVTEDIRLALLMLVTHFYENRSAVTDIEVIEMPMAYNWLVTPYRFYPV